VIVCLELEELEEGHIQEMREEGLLQLIPSSMGRTRLNPKRNYPSISRSMRFLSDHCLKSLTARRSYTILAWRLECE
jgi:hypothetical protein